ncbi:MAG TPA: OsmC family peroxiredoxin [candidate division Zixibacteria bacterium]|nr:OsmC family peroxiredoxin [candidate division Zixibacteria bacterium]
MSGEIKLIARKAGDAGFIARGKSGHWSLMDAGKDIGAMSPFEMLFSSLAGCSGYDVMLVLRKKRVEFDDLWISIEADRAEEHPRVATRIHLHFTVVGDNVPPETVERAIALSQEKYCSVSAMISKAAPIETSFEIIDRDEARRRNPMDFFS